MSISSSQAVVKIRIGNFPQPPSSRKVLVVVGPTASGKTLLAVALARRFNGEIISADSRQVYRGMDIGTGKDVAAYGPKIQNLKIKDQNHEAKFKIMNVPHHLIDVASPRGQFTVARYQQLAYRAIEEILRRGKLPIICGGTGLYVDAVVKGLQFPAVRIAHDEFQNVRRRLDRLTLPRLLARLKAIDRATYRVIDRKNRRRVQRALEIFYATGKPKSAQLKKSAPPYRFLILGLRVPRATLHRRIAARLRQRFRQGLVAEVRRLHRQGVSWSRLDALGLEYRWVSRYLRGLVDRTSMAIKLLADLKDFARRQMTWLKRDSTIVWVTGMAEAHRRVVELLTNFRH